MRVSIDLGQEPEMKMDAAFRRAQDTLIEDCLKICEGNKTKTAKMLGINRTTLIHRMNRSKELSLQEFFAGKLDSSETV